MGPRSSKRRAKHPTTTTNPIGEWTPLGPVGPPPGSSYLIADPVRREALLLVKRRGVEVWRWGGDLFHLVNPDFFPGVEAASTSGWFDPTTQTVMVGAAVSGGLMVAPLTRPTERILIPFGELDSAWAGQVVAFDPEQGDLFALRATSTEQEALCVWRGNKVVGIGAAPHITSIAFDHERRRLVGQSLQETWVLEPGKDWQKLASPAVWKTSQVAWDPGRRVLVRLAMDPSRRGQMRLASLEGSTWTATEPPVWLPAVRPRASLVCLGPDHWLLHGGARNEHELLAESTETFVSTRQHDFESIPLAGQLRLGRTRSLLGAVGAPLAVLDHSKLEVAALTESGWQQATLGLSLPAWHGPHDDRRTTFASGPGGLLYELDGEGGLWRARPGERLEQLSRAEDGPGRRCSGRPSLAHDHARQRLVLQGGEGRNDTWLFDEAAGSWRELLASPRPPHGVGALCSTPRGVYLFVQHELWWLDGERWCCVGHDSDWATSRLFCDPNRQSLWSAASGKLGIWRRGKFQKVAALPGEVSIPPHPWDQRHLVGIDALGDRLFTWDETGARTLPLVSLGEAATSQLPTRPIKPPTTRRSRPPRGAMRAAARMIPLTGTGAVDKVPGVRVPPGYRLLAVVPRHARILPLPEGVSGIAVMVPSASQAYEHTKVIQLQGEPVGVWLRDGAGMRPCELVPFQEIDPAVEEELDTLPEHQFDHAFQTKVGGFGRFVQDDPAPRCSRCQTAMRFALQLGCEVFMVGDMGETYAFVCPRGCGASAVLQTH